MLYPVKLISIGADTGNRTLAYTVWKTGHAPRAYPLFARPFNLAASDALTAFAPAHRFSPPGIRLSTATILQIWYLTLTIDLT